MPTTESYEWALKTERDLARWVQPTALPKEFAWPTYISRLDLHVAEGVPGVVGQLYKLVCAQQLQYDISPFTPQSDVVQHIRKPATLLAKKQATCLDLAVLFAALGLANDLLPVMVVVSGHAFVGFSLTRPRHTQQPPPQPLAWEAGLLTDLNVLREQAGTEYLFLECTGAAHSQKALAPAFPEGRARERNGLMSFDRACTAGEEQILTHAHLPTEAARADQRAFLYALDIHDLQINQGFPPVSEDKENDMSDPQPTNTTINGPQTNIGGNVTGPVISGEVHGPVNIGGINIKGPVSGQNIQIGHGGQQNIGLPATASAIAQAFAHIEAEVNALPEGRNKTFVQQTVQDLKGEAEKGEAANEKVVNEALAFLAQTANDAWEVAIATFISPIAGVGQVFKKIAQKAKEEKEQAAKP